MLRFRSELIEKGISSLEIIFQDAGKRSPERPFIGFLPGLNQQSLQDRFALGTGETADGAHGEPRHVGSKRTLHNIILRSRGNRSNFAAETEKPSVLEGLPGFGLVSYVQRRAGRLTRTCERSADDLRPVRFRTVLGQSPGVRRVVRMRPDSSAIERHEVGQSLVHHANTFGQARTTS
ncbi:hypothetical protein p1B60 (plasmid) [Aromatoleum aromaticum EbN1]|uniref:Uncharacterized protein n=1 Tax=Aromatoleum aromaticum (strain DSM 19018 / LMG 30748 / EbN1) TaxID=76114 RepID=Q5NXC6_AROAE|nr:hypothetical protein p1B60 [Aromatoleum aromaticum EbN1]